MKRFVAFSLAALLAVTFASAQKQRADVLCGPYVQCVSETGFTVVWSTDTDAVAWVEVAPNDGTHFYNRERERFYDSRDNGILPIGKIHKVTVDGLQPGTKYRYRIFSKGVEAYNGSGDVRYLRTSASDVYRGKPFEISTCKGSYDTLRFDIYNDIHGNDAALSKILDGARQDRDFVFLNGDMTSNMSDHELIAKTYLAPVAQSLNGGVPLFVSRGNHELRGKDAIRWFDYFVTTTGTPYYSFSMGKCFFVVLDACEDKPDNDIEYSGIVASRPYMERQEKWLKQVLASEVCRNAEVRIAFCHVPPESKGWYGAAQICERLVPHLNTVPGDMQPESPAHGSDGCRQYHRNPYRRY